MNKTAEAIRDAMLAELKQHGAELAADINEYLEPIATSLAEAVATGDEERIQRLKAQSAALVELQRVRLQGSAHDMLSLGVGLAAKIAAAILTKGLTA